MFFAATGLSDGDLLRSLRYRSDGATTETLVMRSKSGTVRTIAAQHSWRKPARYSRSSSTEHDAQPPSAGRRATIVCPIRRLGGSARNTKFWTAPTRWFFPFA